MSHVETGLSEGQLNCMLKSDAYTGVSKAANQFNWVPWPHSSRLTNRLHIHTNWWTYRASSVYHSLLYLLDYPLNSPAKQSSFSLDEAMNAFTVMRCFFFVYLFISSWESNHSVHPKANVVLQIFHIPVNLRELSTLLNHSLHERQYPWQKWRGNWSHKIINRSLFCCLFVWQPGTLCTSYSSI